MEVLVRFLVPLVFLAVVVIRIILSFKEMQKREGQRREQGGEEDEWTHVADAGAIRRFLQHAQQATRGGPTVQAPMPRGPAQQMPRQVRRGPAGLPPGAVTPGAPRHREVARPPAAPKPAAQKRTRSRPRRLAPAPAPVSQRAAPGSRFDEREPHARNIVDHVKTHKFEGPKGTPKGKLATKFRRQAEAKAALAAEQPPTVDGTESLMGKISRQSLRRAIVMAEVLGKPIGMRAP